MVLLAGWLSSLVASLTVYFTAWFTKRAAFIAAGIASFAAIVLALYTAMAALVGGLSVAFPTGGLIATGVWLFLPDNTPVCLAAMLSADVALGLFFWQFVNLKIALKGAS